MWQPRWERSLGENGYMHVYGWVPLLFTWSNHSIINWLYLNTKVKVKAKKKREVLTQTEDRQGERHVFSLWQKRQRLICLQAKEHQGGRQPLEAKKRKDFPRAGIPNLWDLMPDDLRWNWRHTNRNKVHDKGNALESSRNLPDLVHGKIVFHETSPWHQKCQRSLP